MVLLYDTAYKRYSVFLLSTTYIEIVLQSQIKRNQNHDVEMHVLHDIYSSSMAEQTCVRQLSKNRNKRTHDIDRNAMPHR